MSSIGSVTSSTSTMMQTMNRAGHAGRGQRPDPAALAEQLFAKLDTAGQGYIEQADLQSAISSLPASATSTDATNNAEALFKQLDGNSDGKVTKDEFSDSIKKLSEQLDQQFMSMRMQGGMQGMGGPMGGGMPPPPRGDDGGFTKEQLSSQLQESGSSDSASSNFISNIVNNFDQADSNGDGKVSFQEAMTFNASSASDSETSSTSNSASGTSSSQSADEGSARLMLQIMRLMHAYGSENTAGSTGSQISVST